MKNPNHSTRSERALPPDPPGWSKWAMGRGRQRSGSLRHRVQSTGTIQGVAGLPSPLLGETPSQDTQTGCSWYVTHCRSVESGREPSRHQWGELSSFPEHGSMGRLSCSSLNLIGFCDATVEVGCPGSVTVSQSCQSRRVVGIAFGSDDSVWGVGRLVLLTDRKRATRIGWHRSVLSAWSHCRATLWIKAC